jgi:signal peptidase I
VTGSRLVRVALLLLCLAGEWLVIAPARLGGHASYVVTHGISMEPGYHAGDLAFIRPVASYRVGDVVAYHSQTLGIIVMHRIVAIRDGRYTFKGDHNTWLDPDQPAYGELIGRAVVRVPGAGIWLKRATGPIPLAVLAVVLMAGETVHLRRRGRHRRKRNGRGSPRTVHKPRANITLVAGSPRFQTALGTVATLGVLGIALAALAWTGPVQKTATRQTAAGGQLTFSYTATVPRSPVYDGTTVTAPDPIFRTLANTVDVGYAYQGNPGRAAVTAKLSTSSGWHTSAVLATPARFTGSQHYDTVRLDLKALDARAQAAAKIAGMPAGEVAIDITVRIEPAAGPAFAPTLHLTMTRDQLKLTDPAADLTVKDTSAQERPVQVPRVLKLAGRSIAVGTARTISTVLVLAALLAAATLTILVRRTTPTSESDRICRRYAPLLLLVEPMPLPAGRPTVDVTDFATLVKLAERYGLLVLHWSRSDVHTFLVQDEGASYRYRIWATRPPHHASTEPDEPKTTAPLT